jgi:hypothetical protein
MYLCNVIFFRVKEMEMALEDIQEKLWELDKSWKNNLVSKIIC